MRQSSKPGVRILRWMFAHLPAFLGWIVSALLMFVSGVPNSLLAQTRAATSNAPAVSQRAGRWKTTGRRKFVAGGS